MKIKRIVLFSVIFFTTFFITYGAPIASITERNPYEIFGKDGQYFTNKIFDIFASGNSYDSYNEVVQKAFYKAGQTAYERGCEYFVILDNTISSEITGYSDIQLYENMMGNVSASGGDPIRQASGILTIAILTYDEVKDLDIPRYRALDYYNAIDSIPTDYQHQVQIIAGYVPIPKTGWKINGSYTYIYKRFGFGLGIDYNTDIFQDWDFEYEDSEGTSHWGYANKVNFSICAPIKYYIIQPNTHNFLYMDVCVAPCWHHQKCNIQNHSIHHDSTTKEQHNGFSTDFKFELGIPLELATFDIFVDYSLSTIESNLAVGGGVSFFFR